MSKKLLVNDAKCKGFSALVPVEILKADSDKKDKGEFVITAFTGQVVKRWWGLLAVVVDGIKAKAKMPILRDHNPGQIVGYSKKSWKDGSFFVSGKFSDVTDHAKEVRALADEGFPWQASIGLQALEIVSLGRDEKMEVNGKTLKGPAEVWTKTRVFETSFVPAGADDKTGVARFSKFNEDEAPQAELQDGAFNNLNGSEDMKITLELLTSEAPELLKEIQAAARKEGVTEGLADGAKIEMKRIQGVAGVLLAGHEDLITKLMYDGESTKADAALAIVEAEKTVRKNIQTNLKDDTVPPVNPVIPTDDLKKSKKKNPETEAEFKANKELSEEFGGDFGAYEAYVEATEKGLVRVKKD